MVFQTIVLDIAGESILIQDVLQELAKKRAKSLKAFAQNMMKF